MVSVWKHVKGLVKQPITKPSRSNHISGAKHRQLSINYPSSQCKDVVLKRGDLRMKRHLWRMVAPRKLWPKGGAIPSFHDTLERGGLVRISTRNNTYPYLCWIETPCFETCCWVFETIFNLGRILEWFSLQISCRMLVDDQINGYSIAYPWPFMPKPYECVYIYISYSIYVHIRLYIYMLYIFFDHMSHT